MRISGFSYLTMYDFKLDHYSEYFKSISSSCFSALFGRSNALHNNGFFRTFIYKDDSMNKEYKDNYCLLSDYYIRKYIKWLSEISGVELKIMNPRKSDVDNGFKGNGFFVKAIFKDNTGYEVKLIATMIRMLYEVPFNIQLKTATLMGRLKEFKHLDFSERLCITFNSIRNYSFREVHSPYFDAQVSLINNDNIKKKYSQSLNKNRVSDFYKSHNLDVETLIIDENQKIINDLEKNIINEEYKKILLDNYNLIK